jgi:CMP-N-acetylneuraminic acid synthetase
VIIARAGSKRLPGKNLRPLNGTPLIGYSCRAAAASRLDRVIVSTEDDDIAAVAERFGVDAPFRRPRRLAEDWARSEEIVGHALDWAERDEERAYDLVVLMQPTTPFVRPAQIDACLEAMADEATACCFTARKANEPPEWMFTEDDKGYARLLLGGAVSGDREHSQNLPTRYFPTGGVYVVRTDAMRAQRRILCEPSRMVVTAPEYGVDIDDELDRLYAEAVARRFGLRPVPKTERTR